MVTIPEDEVTLEHLMLWYKVKEDLAKLQLTEVTLRRRIFKHHFPTPIEGTNTFTLEDGYALKGQYKIDRKVDDAALTTLTPAMRAQEIPVDALIKRPPELAVKEYRKLQNDNSVEGKKRLNLFDQCLIIKPSETPALEIVLPKK
jgi:hypothetical protein